MKLNGREKIISDYRKLYQRIGHLNVHEYEKVDKLRQLVIQYSEFAKKYENGERIFSYELDKLNKQALVDVHEIFEDNVIFENFEKVNHDYLRKQRTLQSQRRIINKGRADWVQDVIFPALEIFSKSASGGIKKFDDKQIVSYRLSYIKRIYECTNDYGLHPLIAQRDESFERYNILIEFATTNVTSKKEIRLFLNRDELLDQYVNPYNGRKSVVINGINIPHNQIRRINVSKSMFQEDEAQLHAEKSNIRFGDNSRQSKIRYFTICKDVTNKLINTATMEFSSVEGYVDPSRIKELTSLKIDSFDLKKLCQLCDELNFAYKNQKYQTTGILVRSIIDHVPPIFGYRNFTAVANNYSSKGNVKTFKALMANLDNTSRKIADGIMHSQAREKEALPNQIQIDFRSELDVLLQEVYVILK